MPIHRQRTNYIISTAYLAVLLGCINGISNSSITKLPLVNLGLSLFTVHLLKQTINLQETYLQQFSVPYLHVQTITECCQLPPEEFS